MEHPIDVPCLDFCPALVENPYMTFGHKLKATSQSADDERPCPVWVENAIHELLISDSDTLPSDDKSSRCPSWVENPEHECETEYNDSG